MENFPSHHSRRLYSSSVAIERSEDYPMSPSQLLPPSATKFEDYDMQKKTSSLVDLSSHRQSAMAMHKQITDKLRTERDAAAGLD